MCQNVGPKKWCCPLLFPFEADQKRVPSTKTHMRILVCVPRFAQPRMMPTESQHIATNSGLIHSCAPCWVIYQTCRDVNALSHFRDMFLATDPSGLAKCSLLASPQRKLTLNRCFAASHTGLTLIRHAPHASNDSLSQPRRLAASDGVCPNKTRGGEPAPRRGVVLAMQINMEPNKRG